MSAQANPWPHMGQLFVDQGRLTADELDDALVEQETTGERLGEILVARGHISRIDLAGALSTQWSWQRQQPEDEISLPVPVALVEEPAPAEQHEAPVPVEIAPAEPVVAVEQHEEPARVEAPSAEPVQPHLVAVPAIAEPAPEAPAPVMYAEPAPVVYAEPVAPAAPVVQTPVVVAPPPAPAPAPVPVAPPAPVVPDTPAIDLSELEGRVGSLEESARIVADLQARLRTTYEQLAAAEARLGAIEPVVASIAQAYTALTAQLQAQQRELESLRATAAKHDAQITTAARALLA